MNWVLRYSLDNSDHIVANSQDIFNKVKQVTSNPNVSHVSPGVDLTVMHPLVKTDDIKKKYQIPDDKLILLTAGNAIKRKGFDLLLESLLRLDEETLNSTYLVMLTDGPEKKSYIDFVQKNNLQQFVSIRGKVDHRVLNEYYNIADVFAFPSREEPLGLVGLEAMASDTIVIGSNVGGIKEFVIPNKTGFLFEKENVDELATCIEKVVKNGNNFHHFSSGIDKMVKKHSLENSVNELIEIFKKTI